MWTSVKNNHGYGLMRKGTRASEGKALAHRVSYELANGEIPEGAVIMHVCDNPSCVNPAHLLLGTQRENMHDMARKGRDRKASLPGAENPNAVFTWEQIEIIKMRLRTETGKDIAKSLGVSPSCISGINTGKTYLTSTGG